MKKSWLKLILDTIIEDQKKILLLRSNLKLINSTDRDIEICIISNSLSDQNIAKIKPFSCYYVPFDKTNE